MSDGPGAPRDVGAPTRSGVAAWETRRPLLPELALVGATIAYGFTFVVVQDGLDDLTPAGFNLVRFAIAATVLTPFALRRGTVNREVGRGAAPTRRAFLRAGATFGLVGFLAYTFQNWGLEHTTASNSAFVTGLFVVFAPLIEAVSGRRWPARRVLVAAAGAVPGLFLLTGAEASVHLGDALTLVCAFFFGWWIVLGGRYALRFDPIALTTLQIGCFVLLSLPVVVVTGVGELTTAAWGAVLFTGLVASALAFSLQLWGQQRVPPARAAIILLLEPVFAGVVGFAVGERLGIAGSLGATVILAAIVVAESGAWRDRTRLPA